ncbi:MAG: hypothetical protein LQ337_009022, partial [Flavoplaca oasis]
FILFKLNDEKARKALKICAAQLIESITDNKNIVLQLDEHLPVNIKHNMNGDLDDFKETVSAAKKKHD